MRLSGTSSGAQKLVLDADPAVPRIPVVCVPNTFSKQGDGSAVHEPTCSGAQMRRARREIAEVGLRTWMHLICCTCCKLRQQCRRTTPPTCKAQVDSGPPGPFSLLVADRARDDLARSRQQTKQAAQPVAFPPVAACLSGLATWKRLRGTRHEYKGLGREHRPNNPRPRSTVWCSAGWRALEGESSKLMASGLTHETIVRT